MNPGNGNSPQIGGGELVPYGGATSLANDVRSMVRTIYGPTIFCFGSPGTYSINFQCPDCGRGASFNEPVAANSFKMFPDPLAVGGTDLQFAAWTQVLSERVREIGQGFNAWAPNNIPK